MFKLFLIFVLAIVGAHAQEGSSEQASAEPYSYGYETDSHTAAEQRDPSGKVTGYYTLVDADGRQRRVDYVADEAGFRAKVQTNEVGTKSENSADVEVLASPPTQEQFVLRTQQQNYQTVQQTQPGYRFVQQQQQQQPLYTQQQSVGYSQQYYQPGSLSYYQPGYQVTYGNAAGYGGQRYGAASYGSSGYGVYGGYNNHLPSSYYKSVTSVQQPATYSSNSNVLNGYVTSVQQPSVYTVGGRYVSTQAGSVQPTLTTSTVRNYQVGVPATSVSYQSVPGAVRSSSSQVSSGSSNYIVLKKRDSKDVTQA